MKSDAKGILVHPLGDGGVDLDDSKLEAANVLVGVGEGGLVLGTVCEVERGESGEGRAGETRVSEQLDEREKAKCKLTATRR